MKENIAHVRAGIEKELYINKYHVDEHQPHIQVKDPATCARCAEKPCTFLCPAGVYVWEHERLTVQYSGCLECSSCRFACPHANLDWHYPRGGFGVVLKMG